jgi:hypothetical protein
MTEAKEGSHVSQVSATTFEDGPRNNAHVPLTVVPRLIERLRNLVALVLIVRKDKPAFPEGAERAVTEEMCDVAVSLAAELSRSYREDNQHIVKRVADIGALDQWRRELRAGESSQDIRRLCTWKTDALWRAAGYEAAAREAQSQGLPEIVDSLRRRAISTVLEAAKEKRKEAKR